MEGGPADGTGLLTERVMLAVTGIEDFASDAQRPASQSYAMVESRTWETKMVEGKWW